MEGEHGGLALRVISALWPLGQKQFSPPEIYLSSIYVCECTRVCVCVCTCVYTFTWLPTPSLECTWLKNASQAISEVTEDLQEAPLGEWSKEGEEQEPGEAWRRGRRSSCQGSWGKEGED
jgi:hypothetical protein